MVSSFAKIPSSAIEMDRLWYKPEYAKPMHLHELFVALLLGVLIGLAIGFASTRWLIRRAVAEGISHGDAVPAVWLP